MLTQTQRRLGALPGAVFALALMGGLPQAGAADSYTSATNKSSDWTSTSDGWNKDRIFYNNGAAGPPGAF